MHERECKGYISFNRGVNELNRGVNELNRGVNHSVARQGCNLLRAAVTSAVTSQGCCCGNLQIHPLDLGQLLKNSHICTIKLHQYYQNTFLIPNHQTQKIQHPIDLLTVGKVWYEQVNYTFIASISPLVSHHREKNSFIHLTEQNTNCSSHHVEKKYLHK